MKVITFFAEKGGMGKSTLTAMMASWLAYEKKERVMALDFDYPNHQLYGFRQNDLAELKSNEKYRQMCGENIPFPLHKVDFLAKDPAKKVVLLENIRGLLEGDGYCLMDFPGRFLPDDPAAILAFNGVVDYMVLLADSDAQSRASAMFVYAQLNSDSFLKYSGKRTGQDMCLLWNRETHNERRGNRDWYGPAERKFADIGLEVCPVKIRDIPITRREAGVFGFVRNTLCWPAQNVSRACPYMVDIFEYILERCGR